MWLCCPAPSLVGWTLMTRKCHMPENFACLVLHGLEQTSNWGWSHNTVCGEVKAGIKWDDHGTKEVWTRAVYVCDGDSVTERSKWRTRWRAVEWVDILRNGGCKFELIKLKFLHKVLSVVSISFAFNPNAMGRGSCDQRLSYIMKGSCSTDLLLL